MFVHHSVLTLEDFLLGVILLRMQSDGTIIEQAFRLLDADGDGYIDRSEIREYVYVHVFTMYS